MKTSSSPPLDSWSANSLTKLDSDDFLPNRRYAGEIVARTLNMLIKLVEQQSPLSLLQMNNLAEEMILDLGATPTFKHYHGFPCGVCCSLNQEIVHGIPNHRQLQEGDIISFDLGATYNGAIADSATTVIMGTTKNKQHINLLAATKRALDEGIKAIKLGAQIGVIGNAIAKYVKTTGFSLITSYGGHAVGIDNQPHMAPFISNKSDKNQGVRMQPNMVLAIEPMLVLGSSNKTKTLSDNWTVVGADVAAHEEHSVYLHYNGEIEILTERTKHLVL